MSQKKGHSGGAATKRKPQSHGDTELREQVGYFKYFLCEQGVLLKDFGRYAQKATDALKNNARQIAAQAGRPYMYLRSTVLGKDDLAKKMAKRDGVEEGLICVLATLEMRTSFSVQPNHKTHKLAVARPRRKCLHYYFYFIDPEFGFMHARIQSWFPFEIQVYINGREWLARQLDQRKIGYTRYENTFLQIDDLKSYPHLFCRRCHAVPWPQTDRPVQERTDNRSKKTPRRPTS